MDIRRSVLTTVTALALLRLEAHAQGLTGTLICTVTDAQGGRVSGAVVRVTSPGLIGGPATAVTSETGQARFPVLPPGAYALEVSSPGLATYGEKDIAIG